ncbi:MAG: restriction endonuclease subunit S [Bacteroidales bacterium]|nr:restriction endonuclease subunit S [Bacteroidales bacterium]
MDGNHGSKHPTADEYVASGIPFLLANNITEGGVDLKHCSFITKERASRLDKGFAHNGDVLLTHKGTVGRTAILKCPDYDFVMLTPQVTYYRPLKGLSAEYLKAFFESQSFQEEIMSIASSGATRAYIGITEQRKLHLLIPDSKRQNDFVSFVQRADKSKFAGLKSQFIEMFGNPMVEEQKYPLMKLGDCCVINPKRPKIALSDKDPVSFVPMPSVSEEGYLQDVSDAEYDSVKKGFTYFENGDVLFAKITPCMENGKGAIAHDLTNGIGMGSTEFHVLRPLKGRSNSYWLLTLTRLPEFRDRAAHNMSGTGGQQRVRADFLDNFMIGLPPIDKQIELENICRVSDKSKYLN